MEKYICDKDKKKKIIKAFEHCKIKEDKDFRFLYYWKFILPVFCCILFVVGIIFGRNLGNNNLSLAIYFCAIMGVVLGIVPLFQNYQNTLNIYAPYANFSNEKLAIEDNVLLYKYSDRNNHVVLHRIEIDTIQKIEYKTDIEEFTIYCEHPVMLKGETQLRDTLCLINSFVAFDLIDFFRKKHIRITYKS